MDKNILEKMKKNEKPLLFLTQEELECFEEAEERGAKILVLQDNGCFNTTREPSWRRDLVYRIDPEWNCQDKVFIFPDGSILYSYAYERNSTLPSNIPQARNIEKDTLETGVVEVDEEYWDYFINRPGDDYELRIPKKGDTFICLLPDGEKGRTAKFNEWGFFGLSSFRWCLKPKKDWVEYPIFIGKSPDQPPINRDRYLCLVEHFEEEANWINDLLGIPGFGGIQFENDDSGDWSESLVKIGPNGYPKKPVKARFFIG